MRTLIRITPDIEKGNAAIVDGTMEHLIGQAMDRLNPEAAFFYSDHGKRTANFIFDMADSSDIPSIAEPWFLKLGATVEFFPCMNGDDVRIGIAKAVQTRELAGV